MEKASEVIMSRATNEKAKSIKTTPRAQGSKVRQNGSLPSNFKVDRSKAAKSLSKAYALTQKRLHGEK